MMNDAPRNHQRSPVPLGLMGMIALVAIVELGLIRGNLNFMGNVAVSWKYTGRTIKKKAPGNSILCFGDSMLKFGVLPRVVTEGTGQKTHNFAIHSGSAPSSYFLFRRALAMGVRPSAVVVDFARGILADGPASETRPYPWVELLEPLEAAELCWAAKDPGLVASLGLQSILHSVRLRHEIRAHVMAQLNAKPTGQRDVTPALWRNWNTNDGGQANPKVEAFADNLIPESAPIKTGTWRSDPVNALYVRRFLELAASRGLKVYWTLTPVTPGTFSSWVHSGDEQLYVDFVRREQARYRNVVVLDARDSGFERSVFVDGVHLDRDGAAALSAGISQALRQSMNEAESARTNWIKVPAFNDQTLQVAIEDVGQSREAVKSLGWRKRR
jgi:hypothetical protein